jgi:hypothetical protein
MDGPSENELATFCSASVRFYSIDTVLELFAAYRTLYYPTLPLEKQDIHRILCNSPSMGSTPKKNKK